MGAGKLEDVTENLDLEEQAGAAKAVGRAAAIMARLRRPGGCPWDAEQTFDSIKRHTLEETYEVFDAIERRDWAGLKDELGDLLLQVLFYAEMAQEAGYFTLEDVAENLSAKLVRRHPHVFGEVEATDSDAVLRNWEQIKREEKQARWVSEGTGEEKPSSMLDDIPRSMPAVIEAAKLGSRAAKVGFDWPSVDGLFDKLAEEASELREEIAQDAKSGRVEEEMGDLLFTAVNLARHVRVDAEFALRAANAKFRKRFGAMEAEAGGRERLEAMTADELEALWRRAKQMEGSRTKTESLAGEKN